MTGISLVRRSLLAAVAMSFAVGCGGGSSHSATSSSSSTTRSSAAAADAAAFCGALADLSQGAAPGGNPDAALSEVDASAPAELKADVASFVADARAVMAAFSAAGGASADTAAVLRTLTPEQQQFVKDLASATTGGTISDTSAGHVISYYVRNCTSSSATSSFSSVGSPVN